MSQTKPAYRQLMGDFEPETEDGKIVDIATEEEIENPSPTESVRQWFEKTLIDDYGYEKGQIIIDVDIESDSEEYVADIGVYSSFQMGTVKILAITSEESREKGLEKLKECLEARNIEFGVWTNGQKKEAIYRVGENEFQPVSDIPHAGETVETMDTKVRRKDIDSATDLSSLFEKMKEEITTSEDDVDAADEIIKLIYTKFYDEAENLIAEESSSEFWAGPKEDPEEVAERIDRQFEGDDDRGIMGAKRKWNDVLNKDEEIKLSPESVKKVVAKMQRLDLMNTKMEVLQEGFETLVPEEAKKENDQYFTPKPLIQMAIEMTDPQRYENLLDLACGSGGFLAHTMQHLMDKLVSKYGEEKKDKALNLLHEYASNRLHGLEIDSRLVRIAKAHMVAWGDGRSNIREVSDSLKYFEWEDEITALAPENEFDVVLTNPPIEGEISLEGIQDKYDLSEKDGEELDSQKKYTLFLERAIKHLSPGGQLAIILPKDDLDLRDRKYVRDYIEENTYIRAVVGLQPETFTPYVDEETALLILEKKEEPKPTEEDYEIFMALSEKPGKDRMGNPVYEQKENGELKRDEEGRPIIDTDLLKIAEEYNSDEEPELGYYVDFSTLKNRIDPEFYHPKYEEVKEQLQNVDVVASIGELLDDSKENPLVRGVEVDSLTKTGLKKPKEEGTPYLLAENVGKNEIEIENANKLDVDPSEVEEDRQLKVGDILISQEGKTGEFSVVTDSEIDSIISPEIIKLSFKNKIETEDGETREIDPFYVAAYLNSYYGEEQVERHFTGREAKGLNEGDLKSVNLPIPSIEEQKEVSVPYNRVRELRSQAQRLDEEALKKCSHIGE